jgi:hypothetical protein
VHNKVKWDRTIPRMLNGRLCLPNTQAREVQSLRGTPRAGLRGMRSVRLRVTSADLIRQGVRPELLASLALRRASSGRVAKSGGDYFEWGHPLPSYLTGVFDELTETGLLILADEDEWSLRRVRLSPTGQVKSAQLGATHRGSAPPLRNPQPVTVETPAGRRPSISTPPPAPDGQPVPPEASSCGSVLAPIPDVRHVCALPPGQDSDPDPTPCTDAERAITW